MQKKRENKPLGRASVSWRWHPPSTWLRQVLRCATSQAGDGSPRHAPKNSPERQPRFMPVNQHLKGVEMSWTLEIENQISRRIYTNIVRDEKGVIRGQHHRVSKAIKQLIELDVRRVIIKSADGDYLTDLDPMPW